MEKNKVLNAKEFCEFLRNHRNKIITASRKVKWNIGGAASTCSSYCCHGDIIFEQGNVFDPPKLYHITDFEFFHTPRPRLGAISRASTAEWIIISEDELTDSEMEIREEELRSNKIIKYQSYEQ